MHNFSVLVLLSDDKEKLIAATCVRLALNLILCDDVCSKLDFLVFRGKGTTSSVHHHAQHHYGISKLSDTPRCSTGAYSALVEWYLGYGILCMNQRH